MNNFNSNLVLQQLDKESTKLKLELQNAKNAVKSSQAIVELIQYVEDQQDDPFDKTCREHNPYHQHSGLMCIIS